MARNSPASFFIPLLAAGRGFAGAAWLLAAAGLAAQEPGTGDPGKPLPMDGTVRAVKGQAVTIELAADAKTQAAVVEFLIRDFPLNGDLGPMVSKPTDRTKATIAYTPFETTAATSDSFTYAVRYPGGQWSRVGTVKIELDASEAKIHASAEADFGQVMIGQSETREIFLSNGGNASYRNQLRLEAPWSLVEPADGLLHLPVGGQRTVKVRFAPTAEGPAAYQIAFFRNREAVTRLKASGLAPFTLQTPEIALRWEEKSRTRLGSFTATGAGSRILAASVTADARLKIGGGEAGWFLRPGEPAQFQVYLPPDDVLPYEGRLELAVGGYKLPVKVTAPVAPAYLVVENAATHGNVLDFGPVRAGAVAQTSFRLHNIGGTPAKAALTAGPPFTVLTAGGRATLSPREAESFAVRVTGPAEGNGAYEGALRIEADSGQVIQLTLRALFQPAANPAPAAAAGMAGSMASVFSAGQPAGAPPPPGAVPGAIPPGALAGPEEIQQAVQEMDRMRSPLGFVTRPVVERQIASSVPTVPAESLTLLDEGTRHLRVGWNPPAGGSHRYELEMRVMRSGDENNPLESVWVPHHDVAFEPGGTGGYAAEIRGLAPNHTYEFRLFTLAEGGLVSAPLPFVVKTKMPLDWTWIYASLLLLALGGAGYGGWRYWRRRGDAGAGGFAYPRSESASPGPFS